MVLLALRVIPERGLQSPVIIISTVSCYSLKTHRVVLLLCFWERFLRHKCWVDSLFFSRWFENVQTFKVSPQKKLQFLLNVDSLLGESDLCFQSFFLPPPPNSHQNECYTIISIYLFIYCLTPSWWISQMERNGLKLKKDIYPNRKPKRASPLSTPTKHDQCLNYPRESTWRDIF